MRSKMKKLKITQIGAEHDHATFIIDSLLRLGDDFEVVGYAVPDGEKDFAKEKNVPKYSVDEIFAMKDLDAVAIETSELDLTKYALMAAERGLAVHMDKPGGIELSEFERLISKVKENGTVFHTGYMYRYNEAVIKLMQDVRCGKLGEIYSVEAQMNCTHSKGKREWLGRFPGGMLFFLGCHLIDLIYRIQGEPDEVIPMSCPTGIDGVGSCDFGMAVLKYKNGVSFAKTTSVEPGGFLRRQLVVCGSRGTVQLLPFEAYPEADSGLLHTGVREAYGNSWRDDGERYYTAPADRYDGMMRAFASYVRGDAKNPYTPDYELSLYKLILRCCGK